MSRTTISPAGVKAILTIASLIPLYMAGYMGLSEARNVYLSILFPILAIVVLLHFYYGYKWAKYSVALLTVIFAVTQFFLFKIAVTDLKVLFFLFFCSLLMINTLLLLRANAVTLFLSQQAANRSKQILLYLKISRWILLVVIGVGIIKDLMRLV